MKLNQLLPLAALLLVLSGCATQNAQLQDLSTNVAVTQEKNGTITTNTTSRTITTKLKGTAWFSSSQILEKFKALQTDKTQSVGASSLSQQGATNTASVIKELTDFARAVKGL